MSISDPTPENLQAAASAFNAAYPSPYPHHTATLMMAAAERIALLEKEINVKAEWNQKYFDRISEQDAEIKALRERLARMPTAQTIFNRIAHGDIEHEQWLKTTLFEIFAALPPPPQEQDNE